MSSKFDFIELDKICPEFVHFAKSILDKGFNELDSLYKDNEFWKSTNHLATIHKMRAFADYLIDTGDNPAFGAWLAICSTLVGGQQHLKFKFWQILKNSNQLNSKWLIFSAWNASPYWSDLNINTLSDLIIKLGISNEVKELLDFIVNSTHEKSISPQEWAEIN